MGVPKAMPCRAAGESPDVHTNTHPTACDTIGVTAPLESSLGFRPAVLLRRGDAHGAEGTAYHDTEERR